MRRRIQVAMTASAVAACLAVAGPAIASAKTVCSSGCFFTSIQTAINTTQPGATITIGPGNYYENLVVNKSVTLQGSGPTTVIYPASSMPICSEGSLCGGSASNIVLVEADNVAIKALQLRGDNPNLTSGVLVGGEDIDARNGIITNHLLNKPFKGLTVSKVKVVGVYLRGIYASTTDGTFTFTHDTVENVQAEEPSIAMFNSHGSGVMAYNKVTNANDAISANWSKGTEFLHNTVSKSGSGVHTDNNGGVDGVADVIKANTIRECKTDGYGIFVFVPYVSATVSSNKVSGCSVALAAFGSAKPGEGPTFTGNSANGTGAKTTNNAGSYGAYLTTDELGFGAADVTATLTANAFLHFNTGMFVTQPGGGQATVTATPNNSFVANGVGANGDTGTSVDATNDWWGCPQGPTGGGPCNSAIGTVAFTPWLTAKP